MLRSTEPVLQLFFEVLRVHKFTLALDRMYLRNKYDIKKKKNADQRINFFGDTKKHY